jgi:prolyl-tRNA synthetase
VIVPIDPENPKLKSKAEELKEKLENFGDIEIDFSEKRPGEKFNYWEMKGVPIRIDLGLKDLDKKQITIFRRDLDKKEVINEKDLVKEVEKISKEFTKNLIKKADKIFDNRIKNVKNIKEIKKVIEDGAIARCHFCSTGEEGTSCAEKIEKETGAQIRGTKLDEEKEKLDKCVVCGEKANEIVYIAKAY